MSLTELDIESGQRDMRHSLRSLMAVAIIASAATWFCHEWLAHKGGDISRFVVAGDVFVDPARSPGCLTVDRASSGYDGQFYYRFFIEPFSTAATVAGVHFDYPVYRSQRILYPLVVHSVSLGRPCVVLWAMPLVNIAALMVLVWCGTRVVAMSGGHSVVAVVVGLWPGFAFSLARNLTEPLSAALLMAGLLAACRRAPAWAATCLSLAALTRESSLVAALTLLAYGIVVSITRRRLSSFVFVGALPILVYVCWKLALFALWDLPVSWGGGTIIAIPLVAFFTLLRDSYSAGGHTGNVQVIELIMLAVFAIVVLTAIRRSSAHVIVKLSWAAYFVFVASLSRDVWIEDWAFLRATTEFGVLGATILATATPALRLIGVTLVAVGAVALSYELLHFR